MTHRNLTAVRLRLSDVVNEGGGGCTGLALNHRWILTAAHCVAEAENGVLEKDALKVQYTNDRDRKEYIYGESDDYWAATIYRHPDWDHGPHEMDLALIKLAYDGLELSAEEVGTSVTHLEWDDTPPWKFDSIEWPVFSVAGYGLGSAPGSGIDCTDDGAESGTKRLGQFEFFREDDPRYDQGKVVLVKTSGNRDICDGDSGAPYFLPRGPEAGVPFNFAIHHGSIDGEDGGKELGVLIRPKWSWIREVVNSTTEPLNCPIQPASRFFTQHRRCDW